MKIRIYKTVILSVVLYGCQTWPLDMEEGTQGMFENRVLSRDEVTAGWRKLHNELCKLHNLSSLPNIIRMIKSRKMRWEEHVARMGEKKCIYDIYGKAKRKETLRKTMACVSG
jgi:hypothetical protein